MSNVIQFPRKKQPKSGTKSRGGAKSRTKKRADNIESFSEHAKRRTGGVEIYGEHAGVALFEGCIPVGVMNAVIALLGTAGVAVTYGALA